MAKEKNLNYVLNKKEDPNANCKFFVYIDGKKIDTYDLDNLSLIFVALANRKANLSEITCEKQKINTFEKLRIFMGIREKIDKKTFGKIITELGGKKKYDQVLQLSSSFKLSVDKVLEDFIRNERQAPTKKSNSVPPDISVPPEYVKKNIKFKPKNKE